MTKAQIRKTEQYKAMKAHTKMHGGFNLIGKYKKTDAQIEKWLMDAIQYEEIRLQAMKDMLAEKDFH